MLSGVTSGVLSNDYCSINVSGKTVTKTDTTLAYTIPVTLKQALGPVVATFLQSPGRERKLDRHDAIWKLGTARCSSNADRASDPQPWATFCRRQRWHLQLECYRQWSSRHHGAPANQLANCWRLALPGSLFPHRKSLNLINDSGSALAAPSNVPAGTATVVSNSRCSVNAAGVNKVGTSSAFQVNIPVTFNAVNFGGYKSVYALAFDTLGQVSHWVQGGVLTVQ